MRANQIIKKLKLEIKTTGELSGEAVCKSIAPLFTSRGPWGFKLTNSVKCNSDGGDLVMDADKGPQSWELHVKFAEPTLTLSICRNIKPNADHIEQDCFAKSSVKLEDKRMIIDFFDNKELVYAMVASLYDQLPFKSIVTENAKKSTKVLKTIKGFPKRYGDMTEAKISLTDGWQFFQVENANEEDPSWLINSGKLGLHQKKLSKVIDALLAKSVAEWKKSNPPTDDLPEKIAAPLFKISGFGSLFPKTTSKSAYTPPTIYELRFKGAFERPILGIRLFLEFGLREISSFVNYEFEETEGANAGQAKRITAFYKDSTYYYLIGTGFRFYISDFFIEPSVAIGVSQSTLLSAYPADTLPDSKEKYRAASTRIGFSTLVPLFTIPLLGDLGIAGSFYSGVSKSSTFQQVYLTVSGGASLLLNSDKALARARLSKVALEGYLELTKEQLKWTSNAEDGSTTENSISTAPVSGIFGASMYIL